MNQEVAVVSASPQSNAPDFSVRVMRMLLLHFERSFGRERLEQVFLTQKIPLPLSYFEVPTNFVSFAITQQLQDALLDESGDPDFIRKAALLTVTPESFGFAYYMLKAFGSPRLAYSKGVEMISTFNSVGRFDIERLTDTELHLTHTSFVTERNTNFCVGRQMQFAMLPTLWGLPAATVKEVACQVKGAAQCRYEFQWQPLLRSFRRYVGFAVGSGVGAGLYAAGLDPVGLLAISSVLAGTCLGGWLDARKQLHRKDEDINTQHEGLMGSLKDLQKRYEEVFESNRELEARVEKRTRELSLSHTQLESALARHRELDRVKTEFFDNVSHELRTPLTLILLTLESLLQDASIGMSPDARQRLETMDRSATRLVRLINNLLDLAQMEAGKTRLRYQRVELHGFLLNLLEPFQVAAERKGVLLRLEGEVLSSVHADVEKLDVVFQNLVSNALKFTSAGEVTVRLYEDETYVHIEVRDTGVGMSPQDLPIIFDRFAQADSAGIRRFGGSGIGLALVKETVELHEGRIEVKSELGKGSTFFVRLPKGTAHIREERRERRKSEVPVAWDRRAPVSPQLPSLPAENAPEATAAVGVALPSNSPPAGAPLILLVEDDVEIRRFMREMLSSQYRVMEAADGEEGHRLAMEMGPDLIVSDVMMPVMSGLQMISALREESETADLPIILLTARQEVESRVDGLAKGANDYLGKPFSPRELLARIEAQLRLRDAARRSAENERLAATGLLTSGFAHEVRNPLNGLMNALRPLRESLGQPPDLSMALAMLEVVDECGQRIKHLAESLLSFVRAEDKPVAVDVGQALDTTVQMLRWRIPAGVRIERDFATVERVFVDPGALNQVWVNLLDNALRAVGSTGRIQLSTRQEGAELVASITDNGPGIRPETMKRLFEPFFSTRAAGEGTGLGLALCRRIVLQHGGRIELKSEWGAGARCEVRLPIRSSATVIVSDAELSKGQDARTLS